MADSTNPGQFGKRPDTEKQASKGGQASSSSSSSTTSDKQKDMMPSQESTNSNED